MEKTERGVRYIRWMFGITPPPTYQKAVGFKPDDKIDRWLDFERLDGSLDRLRAYWIEGGGARKQSPRWCVLPAPIKVKASPGSQTWVESN